MIDYQTFAKPKLTVAQVRVALGDQAAEFDELLQALAGRVGCLVRSFIGLEMSDAAVTRHLEELLNSGLIRLVWLDGGGHEGCFRLLVWHAKPGEYQFWGNPPGPDETDWNDDLLSVWTRDDQDESWKRGIPPEWRPGA